MLPQMDEETVIAMGEDGCPKCQALRLRLAGMVLLSLVLLSALAAVLALLVVRGLGGA